MEKLAQISGFFVGRLWSATGENKIFKEQFMHRKLQKATAGVYGLGSSCVYVNQMFRFLRHKRVLKGFFPSFANKLNFGAVFLFGSHDFTARMARATIPDARRTPACSPQPVP